jgi:ankyrin repeat protein
MIKKGANVNSQGYAGFSPLQRACMIPDRKEIAQLLLENGAKVDQPDENGITPLMSASGWGFKDLIALLLEKGADISIKDKSGRSALDFAILKNRKEVIELLKAKGAKPSEKTDSEISISESLITITRQSA